MADQQVSTNLQVIQFRKDFFREYIRSNRLSPYVGTAENNYKVTAKQLQNTINDNTKTPAYFSDVSHFPE